MYDYGDDGVDDVPSTGALSDLSQLANKALRAEALCAQKEEELKAAKEELNVVRRREIPDAMSDAGVDEFTTGAGVKITIKPIVSCSLAKKKNERVDQAIDYLIADKNGGIVRRSVIVEFNLEDTDRAKELTQWVAENMPEASVQVLRTVNAATLKSLIKKWYADGKSFPADLFKASTFDEAKIVVSKK